MKKFIFLLILPIFSGLIFSGCYYPTRVIYVPTEETFAPQSPAVSLEPIFFDFNKSRVPLKISKKPIHIIMGSWYNSFDERM